MLLIVMTQDEIKVWMTAPGDAEGLRVARQAMPADHARTRNPGWFAAKMNLGARMLQPGPAIGGWKARPMSQGK
jgi:hypothetical protein